MSGLVVHDLRFVSLDVVRGVETWGALDERPPGSREKQTVIHPITGKYWIFKYPKDRRAYQIWSELVASYIAGDILGWDVQYVSIGLFDGRSGNLLRYFYDPDNGENLIEGWRLCLEVMSEYDTEKGQQHSLTLLEKIAVLVERPPYQILAANFFTFWARAIALDMLISNTDRHAHNWGVIQVADGARMAPLFDHATSLGCGIDPVGLARYFDTAGALKADLLSQFIVRGRHHLRLDVPAKEGASFSDVAAAFLSAHPETRATFEAVAELDLGPVLNLLHALRATGYPNSDCGTVEMRIGLIYAILTRGQDRVRALLAPKDSDDR